jgi:DNA topoisomerase I
MSMTMSKGITPPCFRPNGSVDGLAYVEDFTRGYTRQRVRGKWHYFNWRGQRVTALHIVERLEAIGLPPAYDAAWFCASPNGHIQAIGNDAKGRRQYRYHPQFIAQQDEAKYGRCLAFGRALPSIRKQVENDISRRDLSLERVVAAVVRMLDLGKIRIGNRAYASANKSFGATTLRNRHAQVKGARVLLDYMGKSGKQQRINIEDRRLSTLVKRCQDMPGQALFQYYDGDGQRHPVSSADVNDYLRTVSGAFTAKDFRTWGASVIAFTALVRANGNFQLKDMLDEVAAQLGNTPAIARKSYVHPALIEVAQSGVFPQAARKLPRATNSLSSEERGLIAFLEKYARK